MDSVLARYEVKTQELFRMVPSFQKVGKAGYNPGIETMMAFDDLLGNPHKKYKVIHVAGTNGKGSVSSMLASVLMGLGYKVGLYTSPHLVDFRERIKVDGEMISREAVLDFLDKVDGFVAENSPSFFEITTAMAFDYFASVGVDYAVVECGLGGRLDSTNIVTPVLSVITSIGLDHTDILGDTLEKVAFEKGGIIKPGVPVVVGEVTDSVAAVLKGIAMGPSRLAIDYAHCGQGGSTIYFSQPTSSGTPASDSRCGHENGSIHAQSAFCEINGHENATFCAQSSHLASDGHENGSIYAQSAFCEANGHENATFCAQSSHSASDGHENGSIHAQSAFCEVNGHENATFCAQTPLPDANGHENGSIHAQSAFCEVNGHENATFCAHFSNVDIENVLSKMDLKGDYQRSNLMTVLECMEVLSSCGMTIGTDILVDSICHAAARTGFRGRWEVLSESPYIVCDIAHNPHGMKPVMEQLCEVYRKVVDDKCVDGGAGPVVMPRLNIVFGVMADKDLGSISDFLPHEAYYFFTAANSPRAMAPSRLSEWMQDHGFTGEVSPDVESAVKRCLSQTSDNDIVYIGGSSYVVAEALKLF